MNFKYPKFLIIIFTILLNSDVYAQAGSEIKDLDVLEQQSVVMMEDYPHVFKAARILDVKPIDDKHSMVMYDISGNYFEAVVNSDRKDLLLVATCRKISLDNLPNIVKDSFKSGDYGNADIIKAFEVTTPVSSVFYRIDTYESSTYQNDKRNKIVSFFFDNEGHYRKAPY